MVKILICLFYFSTCIYAEIESVESASETTSTTLLAQIQEFKSRYGAALSDPLNYSRRANKPVLYLIFAPWSNTFQVFQRDSITDPLIYEYLSFFEVIRIRGDMDQYKKMIPKKYWTRQYPALIAFSNSRELGYLRGEDTVDTKNLYRSLDFWFEQWRKDREVVTGKKPIHPMRYYFEEDYKSRQLVKSRTGYLLKTGWVVHGTPQYIRNKIVTMIENQRETHLPLHLFTDESRKLVQQRAFTSMRESASLVPGDFPINFSDTLDSIPSINDVKFKSNRPVLVLLDPEGEYLTKLENYNSDNRKVANTLTYVKKYMAGKLLSEQMAEIVATFFRVEYPAALVLQSGTDNLSFSNLKEPEELFTIINNENLIREATMEGQEKTIEENQEQSDSSISQSEANPTKKQL